MKLLIALKFYTEFEKAQKIPYGGTPAALAFSLMPPLGFIRPSTMPSWYGWTNHWEDVAETHCYLRKHNGDVDPKKDQVLYEKCRIIDRFIRGEFSR